MIDFNTGAKHPVTDEARRARLDAANDLVQRTLAQHGLAPHPTGGQTNPAMPPIPNGATFHNDTFTAPSGSRSFRTYVPASAATGGVTGIVVMLHGCTQTAEDFAIGTGMNTLAETHRFVVIYPQQSRGNNAQSCWNWFSRGDQLRNRGEPEIIAGIARQAMAQHNVTRDQTFVAGLSAGAAMAVILGETYGDIFSAVGAHSGLSYGAARDMPGAFAAMAGTIQEPDRAPLEGPSVRTIVFHGTADSTVHPANAEAIARRARDRGSRQTIETARQQSVAGRQITRKTTSASDGLAELETWIIDDFGHAWSGGQPGGSYTDAKGPDASAEMIRFFFDTTH